MLEAVHTVGPEPPQRFVDLPGGSGSVSSVDLGHEKRPGAIPVLQRLPHAQLALALVVVPRVVQEIDAGVDGGANDADALRLGQVRLAEVVSPMPMAETLSPVRPSVR